MSHSLPVEGMTCSCCWDDITDSNYVEYQSSDDSVWLPSQFCETCINYLLKTQFEIYTTALAKTTCKAEQRRLLTVGPPINLKDSKALPCPDDSEVYQLWYMSDKLTHSAKLEGSLVGEERTKYWNEQSLFYAEDEKDEEPIVPANTNTNVIP